MQLIYKPFQTITLMKTLLYWFLTDFFKFNFSFLKFRLSFLIKSNVAFLIKEAELSTESNASF